MLTHIKRTSFKLIFIAITLSLLLIVSGCSTSSPPENNDQVIPPASNQVEDNETEPEDTPAAPEETNTPDNQNEPISTDDGQPDPTPEPTDPNPTGQMTVHFIDVGQGDSILIQAPGQNILVDGGEREDGNTVVNYLENLNVSSLDIVVGTHPHEDHIGGLIDVIEAIPVKEVIDPGIVHTTKTFEDYLTLIDEKEITFTEGRTGMVRDIGDGAQIQILHPSSPSGSELNDASIVIRLTFGEVSFLLTGDAEHESIEEMLGRKYELESTILKVSHHGSDTGTSSAFLSAVSPEVAVISCGVDNSYGHPHDEALSLMADAKADIYRTDIHGTIIITTDGQTYDINIKAPYQYNPPNIPEEPDPEPTPAPISEPEPEPEPTPAPSKGEFVGSVKSDKYHYPSCRYAEKILPENEIWFKSVEDAKSHGYVPCGGCKPPSS